MSDRTPETPSTVFVVSDDVLVRFALTQMLSLEQGIAVVGSAPFEEGLKEEIKKSGANVVVLDAILNHELPLRRFDLLQGVSMPLIALTDSDPKMARHILPLIQAGVVGFVQRPEGSDNLAVVREQLVHEIRQHAPHTKSVHPNIHRHEPRVVVAIGSSTGGPEALSEILQQFPKNFSAGVVIVQHMPGQFTSRFIQRLAKICPIPVKEAENGDVVEAGKILVAKGDYHLVFKPVTTNLVTRAEATLTLDPPQWKLRPTVDKMMLSLAPIFGRSMVGVILTGMGQDGVVGMREIKFKGGTTYVQNEETSVVYGMAQEVVKEDLADHVLPLNQIIPAVAGMVESL